MLLSSDEFLTLRSILDKLEDNCGDSLGRDGDVLSNQVREAIKELERVTENG